MIWSVMQEKVYKAEIRDVTELRQRIVEASDKKLVSVLLMSFLYSSSVIDREYVLMPTEDTLNTSFDILLLW